MRFPGIRCVARSVAVFTVYTFAFRLRRFFNAAIAAFTVHFACLCACVPALPRRSAPPTPAAYAICRCCTFRRLLRLTAPPAAFMRCCSFIYPLPLPHCLYPALTSPSPPRLLPPLPFTRTRFGTCRLRRDGDNGCDRGVADHKAAAVDIDTGRACGCFLPFCLRGCHLRRRHILSTAIW